MSMAARSKPQRLVAIGHPCAQPPWRLLRPGTSPAPAIEPLWPRSGSRTGYPCEPSEDDELPQLGPAPTRLIFVCQTHGLLSPMAEALARHAYRRLNIAVQSAGLTSGGADPRAVLVLSEIGIEIDADLTTCVGDVELGAFDLLVSLVIPKLDRQAHQMTLRWDDAASRPSTPRLRFAGFAPRVKSCCSGSPPWARSYRQPTAPRRRRGLFRVRRRLACGGRRPGCCRGRRRRLTRVLAATPRA